MLSRNRESASSVLAELERGRTEIEQRAGDVGRVAELPQQFEALLEECLGSRVLANGEREIAEVVDRARGDRLLVELARESLPLPRAMAEPAWYRRRQGRPRRGC